MTILKSLMDAVRTAFLSKPTSIFITDHPDCPCFKYYRVIKDENDVHSLQIANLSERYMAHLLKKLNATRNILIYTHGDRFKLACFYKSLMDKRINDIYIPDNWFENLYAKDRSFYFHVCNGSRILKGNSIMRNLFGTWVSYSEDIYGVFSDTNKNIKGINKRFVRLCDEVLKKNNKADDIKAGIENIYTGMKEDLMVNNKPIRGFSTYIAFVGKNVHALETS